MSLVDGPFPILIALAAIGLTVVVLMRLPRPWYRTRFAVTAAIALVITALGVGYVHQVKGLIGDATDEYPSYVNVLAGIAVLLGVATVSAWRSTSPRTRALGIAAAVTMMAFTGDRVAIRYGYPRDVRSLLGMEVSGAKQFDPHDFGTAAGAARPTAGGPTTTSRPGSVPSATVTGGGAASTAPATTGPPPTDPPPAAPGVALPRPAEATWKPATALPAHGQLLADVPIPGTASGFAARSAYVWLPPAYFAQPHPALPVYVLLSGVPGQPKNWLDGLSANRLYDQLAGAHHGLAPILVFADYTGGFSADKGCIDSSQGKVETYLTVDVPAFVHATFGTASGPASYGIGGFSDGGTCAVMLGLRHPDVFGPILDFSGDNAPTFNGSTDQYVATFLAGDTAAYAAHDPQQLFSARKYPATTQIWFEAGSGEPKKRAMTSALADAAKAAGISSQFVTKPGKHNFDFWHQCIADSAEWAAQQVGLI